MGIPDLLFLRISGKRLPSLTVLHPCFDVLVARVQNSQKRLCFLPFAAIVLTDRTGIDLLASGSLAGKYFSAMTRE